ncbi:MAG: KH domain-containing protein [Akkermansia sp.]
MGLTITHNTFKKIMNEAVDQIRQFLQLIAVQFVKNPQMAELRVATVPESNLVRFRLILEKSDVARIIGRNGMTASAIRSLAKAAGEKRGLKVIVHMLSHEEAEEEAASEQD